MGIIDYLKEKKHTIAKVGMFSAILAGVAIGLKGSVPENINNSETSHNDVATAQPLTDQTIDSTVSNDDSEIINVYTTQAESQEEMGN